MDERYFMNNRKTALTSMEEIKKRMLERYPPKSESNAWAELCEIKKKRAEQIIEGFPPKPPEQHEGIISRILRNSAVLNYTDNCELLKGHSKPPIRPNNDLLNSVIRDLEAREQRGINKYDTTMDRGDLSQEEWLKRLYDELLDAALYAKKQILMIKEKRSKTLSDLTAHDQELGLYDEPKQAASD